MSVEGSHTRLTLVLVTAVTRRLVGVVGASLSGATIVVVVAFGGFAADALDDPAKTMPSTAIRLTKARRRARGRGTDILPPSTAKADSASGVIRPGRDEGLRESHLAALTDSDAPAACHRRQSVGEARMMANPGAVCGNPRDAASWWLIVDIDARTLRWYREEL